MRQAVIWVNDRWLAAVISHDTNVIFVISLPGLILNFRLKIRRLSHSKIPLDDSAAMWPNTPLTFGTEGDVRSTKQNHQLKEVQHVSRGWTSALLDAALRCQALRR